MDETKFSARRNDRERLIMVITLKSGVQLRVGVAQLTTIVLPEGKVQLHTEPDPTSDRHLGWVDMREIAAITAEYVPQTTEMNGRSNEQETGDA